MDGSFISPTRYLQWVLTECSQVFNIGEGHNCLGLRSPIFAFYEISYPDIFESATFSFRIRLPPSRIRRIRQRIQKKINPLSRVEKNKSATNPITCARVNPDIFKSDDVKSVSSLSPNNKPIGGSTSSLGLFPSVGDGRRPH